MSGNGNLGTIGIGPDLFILPSAIHWLIAVQGAVVAWFFFHLVGACIAYSIVATARNKTVDSSESRRLAKEAARSLVDAVVEPVFVLMGYIVQMISFLVSNLGRVVLVVFGCAMAYVVVNYQQQLIVGIDSAYEALYPAFVVPFRRVIDGAVLLYDLWVALHNALHQFLYEFLLNFFKHTLACTGYFSSFFDILGALAQAIAAAVVAVANWLNADLVGQLDFTPAIAQLRLAAYDLLLRVDCACEGNRGLVSVATIGIINDQSTVVDLTLNYGINSILSIPQVLLASIVASTRTNTYDPPDSDYVINQFEGFVSNLGPLLNQLTHNIVTFIENLLNIDDFGFGKINWTPPPFWSIPQQLAMVILETVRIAARGFNAHRRWHWTRDTPPVRHVRWYCRSIGAPMPETAMNLGHSFWAWLTRTDPPWIVEAREAEAEAEAEAAGCIADDACDKAVYEAASERGSISSSKRSAQELAAHKRRLTAYGLVGTLISWALFVWFIFTYGMLVYRLLGEGAESEFARSWGISYGLNAATEWKDIVTEAAKAAVVLVILERLYLTRNSSWLEEHIDYLSLQSLLFTGGSLNIFQQTKLFFSHTKRLTD